VRPCLSGAGHRAPGRQSDCGLRRRAPRDGRPVARPALVPEVSAPGARPNRRERHAFFPQDAGYWRAQPRVHTVRLVYLRDRVLQPQPLGAKPASEHWINGRHNRHRRHSSIDKLNAIRLGEVSTSGGTQPSERVSTVRGRPQ